MSSLCLHRRAAGIASLVKHRDLSLIFRLHIKMLSMVVISEPGRQRPCFLMSCQSSISNELNAKWGILSQRRWTTLLRMSPQVVLHTCTDAHTCTYTSMLAHTCKHCTHSLFLKNIKKAISTKISEELIASFEICTALSAMVRMHYENPLIPRIQRTGIKSTDSHTSFLWTH